MTIRYPSIFLLPLLACLAGTCNAQTVRFHGDTSVVTDRTIAGKRLVRSPQELHAASPSRPSRAAKSVTAADVCSATAVDWHGQPLPDGEAGTLSPLAFMRSATINGNGRIAFAAQVEGAQRNQGIFTADASGLNVVALGCGAGGGSGSTDTCGDPTPLGGTFGGFHLSTVATPAINDHGDVLFLADVVGGSSARGLFLFREASHSIIRIAAVGDPSPLGGFITTLGAGSMNNAGTIAFLAVTDAREGSDILLWEEGTVTKFVAAGDTAPGGGTFWAIGTELWGFQDGTSLAGGPVPGINQNGLISFRGYVNDGIAAGGLFLSLDGVHQWTVAAGDSAPGGGTYADFAAPLLNNAGEIAFFSDIANGPPAAWVAGKPGQWRRAIAPYDEINGGTVWGTAYSRNPMSAFADNGDLVLWTSILMADQTELGTALVSKADDSVQILAVQGTAGPFGGYWGGSMDGWPAMNNANQIRIGSATPGFALSADIIVTPCAQDRLFQDGFDG